MNRYGEMARSHWATWLPQAYAAIQEPDSFFSAIGEEAARQVDELASQLAGDGRPGEGYLERAGRLTAARSQAEEIILPQRVLPQPETPDDEDQNGRPSPAAARPLAISQDHPTWAEVNAEQRERLGLDG
jgi:hypothetical protein